MKASGRLDCVSLESDLQGAGGVDSDAGRRWLESCLRTSHSSHLGLPLSSSSCVAGFFLGTTRDTQIWLLIGSLGSC